MRERIQTLDGLRFLAALGVLWIHTWTYFGNPRCYFGRIDMASILAIGGNGVDLFFVISGFCMYYFYASRTNFSYHDFFRFILKRWIRLSPAFYTATIVYALIYAFLGSAPADSLKRLMTSTFYLNSILPAYNAASHFWTLGVEWQFYLIIPFLLIYQRKYGFQKTFLLIFGTISLAALLIVLVFKGRSDFFVDQILFRGVEFGTGIIAGRLLVKNFRLSGNSIYWLILFTICIYTGRLFISKPVLAIGGAYYNLFKLSGFALMGMGFSGILYQAVTSKKWLHLFLGNRLFKMMGRISYSFYLWHGLVLPVVASFVLHSVQPKGIWAPIVSTIGSTVLLYPVSYLSYRFLEKPFLAYGNLTTR